MASLIGVDWGTSQLRAYLLDGCGAILDRREAPRGILTVEAGGFPGVLAEALAGWPGGLPVILSGMVGSRQGWVEAPYLPCPARPGDLAGGLVALDAPGLGPARLVPGISHRHPDGHPDVIRGEETQIAGALMALGLSEGLFVLGGTHSKWVRVEGGAIAGFSTYMTGEVFAALRGHTILGRLMPSAERGEGEGFRRGVTEGAALPSAGALLARLFSVRTLGLFDELPGRELSDYLSGLLIGAEMAAATREGAGRFIAVKSQGLERHYDVAADILGLDCVPAPADCVVLGHLAIARAAGLVAGA